MIVKFKKLDFRATIPTRSNPTDAGVDFYATKDITIEGLGSSEILSTGIAWSVDGIPEGINAYMQIQSRSGLAFNHGVECTNAGVIDQNYRGEIKVKLYNHSSDSVWIRRGDRIAQGIVKLIPQYEIQEALELDSTDRGALGFGSSGR
jgi:dUTP pyrophosphatase